MEFHDTDALTALGHPGRLAVFRLLARRAPHGVRPSEIADALALKPNTLSIYVKELTRAGLLRTWRDGRSVFYGIDLERVGGLVDFLVNDCCRGRPELCVPLAERSLQRTAAAQRPTDVLFVCTGNSARSVFAEAVLSREGGGRFRAHSAGTSPAAALRPEAVAVLAAHGHDPTLFAPKGVGAFETRDAPRMDLVITLCDQAANEECPPLPGLPVTAHWSVPAPSAATVDRQAAFESAYDIVASRVSRFLALPFDRLDPLALQRELDAIGGAPTTARKAG
jgi:arsenate reductase